MVLGLGGTGLPQRRSTTKGSNGSRGGASGGVVRAGASSSSQPGHSMGGEAQPAQAVAALSPAPRDQLLGPILQASLAQLGQQQQAQQAAPQHHPTLSGSSVALHPGQPQPVPAGATPEPHSADVVDHAATAVQPSPTAAAAGSADGTAFVQQQQAEQGKSKRQAAIKRKLRAEQQQAAVNRATSQVVGGQQRGPRAPEALGQEGVAEANQAAELVQEGGGARAPLEQAGVAAAQPALRREAAPAALGREPEAQQQQEPGQGQQRERPSAGGQGRGRGGKGGRGRGRGGAAAGGSAEETVVEQGAPEGGVATPAAAKRGKGKKRRRAAATPSKYADLIGRTVEVPAALFKVDVPGLFYRGRVTKHEGGRKQDAMEVKFFDDGSKYWFPIADIRTWLAAIEERGAAKDTEAGIASGRATDEFAAEVLTDIASGRSLRSGRGTSQLSDAAVGPSAKARPDQQQQRGHEAEAREGPLTGAALAMKPGQLNEDRGAVSSKRRRAAAAAGVAEGLREEAGTAPGGGEGLAALHVMADAAGMNLLSPLPREYT